MDVLRKLIINDPRKKAFRTNGPLFKPDFELYYGAEPDITSFLDVLKANQCASGWCSANRQDNPG